MKPKNNFQRVEGCRCGNEYLLTYKTFGTCWETYGCPICIKHWAIERFGRQFYLDLRNLVRKSGMNAGWEVEDAGNLNRINKRVRRTMWFACNNLGTELASIILNKAIKDYWNEVKGHWVHSHRCGSAYRPQQTLQRQREDRVAPL